MIRKVKDHSIYEVWNEWAAESIFFIDHKPTAEELLEICEEEGWFSHFDSAALVEPSKKHFVKKYIYVDKLVEVYARQCGCGMCKGGVQ